jgi:hypothetical protein
MTTIQYKNFLFPTKVGLGYFSAWSLDISGRWLTFSHASSVITLMCSNPVWIQTVRACGSLVFFVSFDYPSKTNTKNDLWVSWFQLKPVVNTRICPLVTLFVQLATYATRTRGYSVTLLYGYKLHNYQYMQYTIIPYQMSKLWSYRYSDSCHLAHYVKYQYMRILTFRCQNVVSYR